MSFILVVLAAQLTDARSASVVDPGVSDGQQVLAQPTAGTTSRASVFEASQPSSTRPDTSAAQSESGSSDRGAGAQADQGSIIVSARRRHAPGDPMQAANAKSYAVTQSVDKAFVGPVALGYRKIVPAPIRSGLHNAIFNLREPTIFVNYMLQLKPGKAAETLGRFAINSTVGIAGFIDVAKRRPFSLPHRPNGFADSFGYYGIKSGPYIFLPLVGPTTLRDLFGGALDRLLLPVVVGKPFNQLAYSIPTGVVSSLDHRVEIDDRLYRIRGASNPYAAMRADYLARRQAEIDGLKGKAVKPNSGPAAQ